MSQLMHLKKGCAPIILLFLLIASGACGSRTDSPGKPAEEKTVVENTMGESERIPDRAPNHNNGENVPAIKRVDNFFNKLNYEKEDDKARNDLIVLLENLLQQKVDDPKILWRLAKLYEGKSRRAAGDSERAEIMTRAKELFAKSLEIEKNDPLANYAYAKNILSEGPFDQNSIESACGMFENAIRVDPDYDRARLGLARCYCGIRLFEKAVAQADKLMAIDKADPGRVSRIMLEDIEGIYREAGLFDKAEAILIRIIEPLGNTSAEMIDRSQLMMELGWVYMEQGKLDQARKAFEQTHLDLVHSNRSIESHWGCLYEATGNLYLGMGQNKKACVDLRKSADRERENSQRQLDAAIACHLCGDAKNALLYIERALGVEKLQYGSFHRGALIMKGYILITLRRFSEAEAIFRPIVDQGGNFQVDIGLGHVALGTNRLDLARNLFARWVEDKEAMAAYGKKINGLKCILDGKFNTFVYQMAFMGMGWILVRQNSPQEAIYYFNRVLQQDSENVGALLAKGNALGRLERYEEAEATIKIILKSNPKNARALSELALIYYNRGELEKAVEYFQTAKKEGDKNYTCPYEGLGLVYLAQGRTAEAKTNLEKAIAINPDIEYKKYNALAKIYLREGKKKKAKELLKKSMANNPNDEEAAELLAEAFDASLD